MSSFKRILAVNGDSSPETCKSKLILNKKRNKCDKKAFTTHIAWEGTDEDTECEKFKRYVQKRYNLNFESDRDFHKWSVEKFEDFWEAVWNYFNVIASKPYEKVFVKTGTGFLDCEWFTEARFNLAENLMAYRDETIALICEDEKGNTDSVTFADMYEEVKLYSAAFRRHGLQKGDRVACIMSNRKEAIFAMLATLSIGGLWAGVMPLVGAKYAASIVSKIEPKFLLCVDSFQFCAMEYDILSNLSTIVEDSPLIEKIIIVNTKDSTAQKSIAHIKNCCLLQDFLESGKQNNIVPDIIFEQLPASHPVYLTFTSGTTGIPKGMVHSAKVLLSSLTYANFIGNLKQGDVVFCNVPMGWVILLGFSQALHFGVTIYLFDGHFLYPGMSRSIWDIILDIKITYLLLLPSEFERLEKMGLNPKPETSYESLKIIGIGGCPVKNQNVNYLTKHLPKNIFIGNFYGSTEGFGFYSGAYLKSPAYAGEIQLPALGIDLKCYNDEGESVIGEIGISVITTPSPCFPINLWKDVNNTLINQLYLTRFPGVWCQNDVCFINPKTNGIRIKGRSDLTFVQYGERFEPEDIYFAIHNMEEIEDYICASQYTPEEEERVILFIKLKSGYKLTPSLIKKIEDTISNELIDEYVPQFVLEVKGVPYNMSNKRMESLVKKILATNKIPEVLNIRNPECLKSYCNIPELLNC